MTMRFCSPDLLALVAEINTRRIAMVCGRMAQRAGGVLRLTDVEVDNLKFARRLHARMRDGDYRMELREWHRLRDLCMWLQRKHEAAHGLAERPGPSWDEGSLWQKHPAPAGSYPDLAASIAAGGLDGMGALDES